MNREHLGKISSVEIEFLDLRVFHGVDHYLSVILNLAAIILQWLCMYANQSVKD